MFKCPHHAWSALPVLALAAALSSAPASAVTTDAATDFNTTTNSATGTWSYRTGPALDGNYSLLPTAPGTGPDTDINWAYDADGAPAPEPGAWTPASGQYPFVAANNDAPLRATSCCGGNVLPSNTLLVHPPNVGVAVISWRASVDGTATASYRFADFEYCGDGITWTVEHRDAAGNLLATVDSGSYGAGGSSGAGITQSAPAEVMEGEFLHFVIDPNGGHACDETLVEASVELCEFGPGSDEVLYEQDFSDYVGDFGANQYHYQYQSGLQLAVGGTLPGWIDEGAGFHFVDLANGSGGSAPSNYALMIFDGGVPNSALQLDGIADSNRAGTEYRLTWTFGAAVYYEGGQASTGGQGLRVELMRADDTVLASKVSQTPAWTGAPALEPDELTYQGDGSGPIRLRIAPSEEPSEHFAGMLDDLTLLEVNSCADGPADGDGDGFADDIDNCPILANADQTDTDSDGAGDACDADDDGDGIADAFDNCQYTANADQANFDGDAYGDACDSDPDGDGVEGGDNCPMVPNADQTDTDGDGEGDDCDTDDDGDAICDLGQGEGDVLFSEDFESFSGGNFNGGQLDSNLTVAYNGNVAGWDKQGGNDVHVVDLANQYGESNPSDYAFMIWTGAPGSGHANILTQSSSIEDSNLAGQTYRVEYLAGPCVYQYGPQATSGNYSILFELLRADGTVLASHSHQPQAWVGYPTLEPGSFTYQGDGSGDVHLRIGPDEIETGEFSGAVDDVVLSIDSACSPGPDNCPTVVNADQADLDGDAIGDACDADLDGDGIDNELDTCPEIDDPSNEDTDSDGWGDACDDDDDNDGVLDGSDNCALIANAGQSDLDGDGQGDACDGDLDGDGVANEADNCESIANGSQVDFDGDGEGDACDADIDGDGVVNAADDCAGTELGAAVLGSGCSLEQLCPCDGPSGSSASWRNHGKYVSCNARATNQFVAAGLMTDAEKDEAMSDAAESDCGR